ncbi:MAG: hypothetical protein AB4352_18170 [Hormoscilla sp.]
MPNVTTAVPRCDRPENAIARMAPGHGNRYISVDTLMRSMPCPYHCYSILAGTGAIAWTAMCHRPGKSHMAWIYRPTPKRVWATTTNTGSDHSHVILSRA